MLNNVVKFFGKAITLAVFFLNCSGLAVAAAEPDRRASSIRCAIEKTGQTVECDYRHAASLEVKDVSLSVANVLIQIPPKGYVAYPSPQQSTALLFLVDVSDPKRKNTVEKKNVAAIKEMLATTQSHQKVGLAVFDSDLRVLAPIGADAIAVISAASTLKASGAVTEFYKNILAAIAILQKTDASRKGLIIMSDGKDEDRAYGREDVVKAARDADVVILGLGYLERPQDTPSLENIKRLATETHGLYFDATAQALPVMRDGKPFSFVEKGGRVSFDVGQKRGKQSIALVLRSNDGKPLALNTEIVFPDRRTRNEQAIDLGRQYWKELLAGLLVFMGVVVALLLYRRRRRLAAKPAVAYASLSEMDGSGTQHVLTQTAVRVGRSADNDICLANDTISLHHAEIHRRRGGDVQIVDLGSANGVYVNDTKVTRHELSDGDVLELGEVRLRFTAN